MMKAVTYIIFLVFSSNSFAGNHSGCAQFNNVIVPSLGWANEYILMDEKGGITPTGNIISSDKSKNPEVYTFKSKGLGIVGGGGFAMPIDGTQNIDKIFVARDSKGMISSITYDHTVSQKKLDLLEKTRQEKIKFEGKHGKSFHPPGPFTQLQKRTITFRNEDGNCVPDSEDYEYLVEPKVGGKTKVTTSFKIDLCKDLHDLLDQNPELKKCTSRDLNQKFQKIFDKHLPRNSVKIGDRSFYGNDVEGFVGPDLNNLFKGPDALSLNPISKAIAIRQDCFSKNLEGFYDAIGSSSSAQEIGTKPVRVKTK